MKGQKLFVRPRESADLPAVRAFFAREVAEFPESLWEAEGIVAKLVGEIAAHVAIRVTTGDELWIEHIYVARELRRKRVGRATMADLEKVASGLGCRRLVVRNDCSAKDFFRKLGFAEREGRFEKSLPEDG